MPLPDPYNQPITPPRRLRFQVSMADLSPDELSITPQPALLVNSLPKRRKRKYEDVIQPMLLDLDFLDEQDEMGLGGVRIVGVDKGGKMVEGGVEMGGESMEEGGVEMGSERMEESVEVVKKKKMSKLRPKMTFAEKMKALQEEEDSVQKADSGADSGHWELGGGSAARVGREQSGEQIARQDWNVVEQIQQQTIDRTERQIMDDLPTTGPSNVESSVQTRDQVELNGVKQVDRIIDNTAKARRNIDTSAPAEQQLTDQSEEIPTMPTTASPFKPQPHTPLQPQTPSRSSVTTTTCLPPSTTSSAISEFNPQRNYTTIPTNFSPLRLKFHQHHQDNDVETTQTEPYFPFVYVAHTDDESDDEVQEGYWLG
ncbi:hypothetical protein GE09DRAFT_1053972 [Coniochaeta sp. 2T2.1]|nr:hypothetical protein GE09DRAFT_1053972 [Coniochaeta sp. 2T2.1]